MKKILLLGGGVVVVMLLALFGYAGWLVHSLNTPEFKKAVLDRATTTVGSGVRVAAMDISLLSGVTLKRVSIANPAPFAGDLLSADAFVLRYRLRPLLSGQLEIERLALEKPLVRLQMDAKGAFNYERLGGTAPVGSPAPAGTTSKPSGPPIDLVLKKLAVENATIVMEDAAKAVLMSIQAASLDSAFTVTAAEARGSGQVKIGTVDLAESLFVRDLIAPISLSKESFTLAPIRGRVADGEIGGQVKVNLKGGFRYTAEVEVKGASVKKLLAEAKSARIITGTLAAKASFEGTGGLPTLKGKGRIEVAGCAISNAPVLAAVAAATRVPELANPDFDQCLVDFTLGANRLETPVVSLKGKQIQLTGHGTTSLDTYALDYDLTLALGTKLLEKIPVRELRAAFHDRGDGFSSIDFKVTGTSAAPKTDLAARVGKSAATEAAVSGLSRLLTKKKPR